MHKRNNQAKNGKNPESGSISGLRVQTNLVVELAVETLTIGIDQFEGVGAIAVHVTKAIR